MKGWNTTTPTSPPMASLSVHAMALALDEDNNREFYGNKTGHGMAEWGENVGNTKDQFNNLCDVKIYDDNYPVYLI